MTSITWKVQETGQKLIKIYRSKDKLEKELKGLVKGCLTIKDGKRILHWEVYSVSYEEKDEKAIFQKYRIVPDENEYL